MKHLTRLNAFRCDNVCGRVWTRQMFHFSRVQMRFHTNARNAFGKWTRLDAIRCVHLIQNASDISWQTRFERVHKRVFRRV